MSYWSKKGVPHLEGNPLTLGINFKLFSQGPEIYTKDQFERCGKVYGVASAFRNVLVVNDAELIKQIMIKDFHLFMDKPTQGTWDDMWNLNLFMSGGDAWKRIRTIVRYVLYDLSDLSITNNILVLLLLLENFEQCIQ